MALESLMDENIIDALKHHFGNKMDGLSHYQIITLALAYSEEEITNEKLQHVLDIHRADITNMLSKMCSQQLLDSYGYGRGKKYYVYGLKAANLNEKVVTSDGKVATLKRDALRMN